MLPSRGHGAVFVEPPSPFTGLPAMWGRIFSCRPIFNRPLTARTMSQEGRLEIGPQDKILPHNFSQLLRNPSAERFDSGAYAGWIFFNWHEFVAALLGLPSEFRLESLFTLGISLCPNRGIVLDLLFNHRVEDDCDFVGSRRSRASRSKFALHPSKIVSHRSLVVM